MGKYTGCQCLVCRNQFRDEDDIVVCPECGTPYHRSCYKSAGQCINTPLHAIDGSWQSIQDEHRRQIGGTECPHCQHINLPGTENCASCGSPLEKRLDPGDAPRVRVTDQNGTQYSFPITDPCCGMSPNEDYEGERLGDIARFVRSNTLYYIPLFHRFKDSGRKISVNLPCILFPYYYFAHRKMWLMAFLTAAISIICNLPNLMLNMLVSLTDKDFLESMQGMLTADVTPIIDKMVVFLQQNQDTLSELRYISPVIMILMNLLLCLFGNYFYYRFVLRSVKKIRRMAPNESVRSALLHAGGGTNIWNILGFFFLYQGMSVLIVTILLQILS